MRLHQFRVERLVKSQGLPIAEMHQRVSQSMSAQVNHLSPALVFYIGCIYLS